MIRKTTIRTTIIGFALALWWVGCGSGASSTTTAPQTTPEPPPPEVPDLSPVPHDGPLRADPAVDDCGEIRDLFPCELEILLTHNSAEQLVIDEVAQNFSPFARVDLIEERTAFTRDLPYTMGSRDRLVVLFYYRRDDPNEQVGGSIVVSYRVGARAYELEVPIGAR